MEHSSGLRPNFLILLTDQQHAGMVSCAGNECLRTPALDELAARGVRFERAYSTNPVCVPARASLLTGRMPSAFGVEKNGPMPPGYSMDPALAMGYLLRNAGYETTYGGKTHFPFKRSLTQLGFEELTSDDGDGLAKACADFLQKKRQRPFLMVASFRNPHDICYMVVDPHLRDTPAREMCEGNFDSSVLHRIETKTLALACRKPQDVSYEEFMNEHCPQLPTNHEPSIGASEAVLPGLPGSLPSTRNENWDNEKWRLHRWAYARLTEKVDAQIGRVLQALSESNLEENTVIIFTSDHGDMDGAHKREHKDVPYDESARVPLIVSLRGQKGAGRVDTEHLVSNGLDIIPTICDYAGVRPPDFCKGLSLREIAEGGTPASWRDEVVSEIYTFNHSGRLLEVRGRMLRTLRYKYVVYETGRRREMLFDMEEDPGEMRNLAMETAYSPILTEHRVRLLHWCRETSDRLALGYLITEG